MGLVLLLTLPAPAVTAFTGDAGTPTTAAELLTLFGAPSIRADYVLVIDTSSSMVDGSPSPAAGVRQAVAGFAKAVPQGDRVSLLFFDVAPTIAYSKAVTTATDRLQIAAKVAAEPFNGSATDIGAALSAAQQVLAAPSSSDVETLLFLSDGRNNPGPASPYPVLPVGPEWRALGVKGRALGTTRTLSLYGVGVGTAAGVSLLRVAFPGQDVSIVDLAPSQLAAFFKDVVVRTQLAKIYAAVADDLSRGVSVRLETEDLGSPTEGRIVVTNNRQKLDTDVSLDEIAVTDSSGAPVAVSIDNGQVARRVLAPGESITVPVSIATDVARGPVLGTREESLDLTLKAKVRTSTPSAELLRRLYSVAPYQITAKQTSSAAPISVAATAQRTRGIPWWAVALAGALLLVAAAIAVWLIRLWRIPPELHGVLTVRSSEGKQRRIVLSGKRLTLPNLDVAVDGDEGSLAEFFTKPGPSNRRRVFVAPRRGVIRLVSPIGTPDGEPVDAVGVQVGHLDTVVIGRGRIDYEAGDVAADLPVMHR